MNKQILRLAIPNIISNLSVPLLGAVDTALVGHLDQVYYLGALAVGGIIFDFLYWGMGFLRMGTTGLTAQAYGRKDDREVVHILVRTLMLALVSGLILIGLQSAIAHIGFTLINATPEVENYAREYFQIRIFAAPATLALYAFHGWFLGLQNAKYPLYLTVLVNVVNVVLNVLFIRALDMKSDGVAYGTVIAQYVGLIVALFLFWKNYSFYLSRIVRNLILETQSIRRIVAVNRDIFLRTLGLIFTFSYFTAKSAESGDDILAVNSILLQLFSLLAYGVDGFAFAAESMVGKFVGEKDQPNLRRTVNYSFAWGLGLGALFSLTFALLGQPILEIFTNKQFIVSLAMTYMFWIILAPLTSSVCFIWDGIFIGATATAEMRNSMLFCAFAVFVPAYHLLRSSLENHSLWLAFTLFMIMRGVTMTWYAKRRISALG